MTKIYKTETTELIQITNTAVGQTKLNFLDEINDSMIFDAFVI